MSKFDYFQSDLLPAAVNPTRLTAEADGCFKVEQINFLMPGDWEVRVKFRDRDSATLNVEIFE